METDEVASSARRALRERFGFADVAFGERLEGGYANDRFQLVADGTPLVLRIKHPPVLEDDVAWEHRLTRHLADRLPEVPAPLLTRDGASFFALGERVAWLLPLIPAEPAIWARRGGVAATSRLQRGSRWVGGA